VDLMEALPPVDGAASDDMAPLEDDADLPEDDSPQADDDE